MQPVLESSGEHEKQVHGLADARWHAREVVWHLEAAEGVVFRDVAHRDLQAIAGNEKERKKNSSAGQCDVTRR